MSEDIKEEEQSRPGFVAFCSECKTVLPDEIAKNNVHLQAGHPGVCKLCGGVVVIAREDQLKRAMRQTDSQRGLG